MASNEPVAGDPLPDEEDDWEVVDAAPELLEVADLDRIELMTEVTHPVRGRIVRLLRRPRSVAELADSLDVPVTRLYHHLHRLEEHGLVAVVATRRVGAATERRYRASAAAYRVPADVLGSLEAGELSTALGSVFDLARLDFQRGIERGPLLDLLDVDDERGGVVLSMQTLRLTDDRRRELAARLVGLVAEFADDDGDHPVTTFVASFPTE